MPLLPRYEPGSKGPWPRPSCHVQARGEPASPAVEIADMRLLKPGDMVTAKGFARAYRLDTVQAYLTRTDGQDFAGIEAIVAARGEPVAWAYHSGRSAVSASLRPYVEVGEQIERAGAVEIEAGALYWLGDRLLYARVNGEAFADPIDFLAEKPDGPAGMSRTALMLYCLRLRLLNRERRT